MKNLLPYLFSLCLLLGTTAHAQVLLDENFESGQLPAGWSRSQNANSVGWEIGTRTGLRSQFFNFPVNESNYLACSNDDLHDAQGATNNLANEDRLITPPLDMRGVATAVLAFDAVFTGQYGSTAAIEASTDGGNTWTSVQSVSTTGGLTWNTRSALLSGFSNDSAVLIAFRHNDTGNWASGFALDNVKVYVPQPVDASIGNIQIKPYVQAGIVNIVANVTNEGLDPITSITLAYSVDGGAPVTYTRSNIMVNTLGTTPVVHLSPPNLSDPRLHDLDIWIESVNGQADGDAANDSSLFKVSVLSKLPEKRVLLEDYSGTWCQFCPDGTVIAEGIIEDFDWVTLATVHAGDALEIPAGGDLADTYIDFYPAGAVDQFLFPDYAQTLEIGLSRTQWRSRVQERRAMPTPLELSFTRVEYDSLTGLLQVDLQADFFGEVNLEAGEELRFNLYVMEDSVTGYPQANAYNTDLAHPYGGAGDPIINFPHNKTVREMVGGSWGAQGSLPATNVTNGGQATYTFVSQLPLSYPPELIDLVGMVRKYDDGDVFDREIFNVVETALLGFIPVSNEAGLASAVSVYPNPAREQATVALSLTESKQVTVTLTDLQGRQLSSLHQGFLPAGQHEFRWDGTRFDGQPVANGVYLVHIRTENDSHVVKLNLQR